MDTPRQAPEQGHGTVPTGAPPLAARVLAFGAIILAGATGGFIGYAVTDLQCSGECTVNRGFGGLVGAVIAATGVAIVSMLALRAMSEWRTIQQRDPDAARREQETKRRASQTGDRPRPRVQ